MLLMPLMRMTPPFWMPEVRVRLSTRNTRDSSLRSE